MNSMKKVARHATINNLSPFDKTRLLSDLALYRFGSYFFHFDGTFEEKTLICSAESQCGLYTQAVLVLAREKMCEH